ncbi:BirA family transcriptional regulator, biotin operon repressor / biotin-[acetyl-CoA-carboxylase] ligase [Thermotomaculum hydrothermale]|uniref:BirA family transcriptional regulator, biotin operon repressor / biotin-[acetyl-CoA-carboxylase] ligase n=1 Tax=Thermotomaculum hydrothermale TaxID=981385 RepID=A0A7R6Q0P9_9BACT|nr:biotin--[acetyl-CoA-carboxylase] ligase [Thermotomaculum hydrothermale]BBB33418.1 BirA family transcriptional regulator, biotin operon repressor / biotin-[acetyl-CoA-carboxylase] ligase [Thermotomaculum hydrothermale]
MKIVKLKKVDSTNKEAFRFLEKYPFVVVTSDIQTAGYGRNNSNWLSVSGNIHLSIGKITDIESLKYLSVKVVCEVFDLFSRYVSGELKIKWPNDILLNGKKIAGILIESRVKGNIAKVVIGIGINFNYAPIEGSESLKGKISISKDKLESLIIKKLSSVFDSKPNNEILFSTVEQNSYFKKGDLISLNSGEKTLKGVFKGFTPDFAIVIEHEGKEAIFYSGEVKKVRKN